MPVYAAPPTHTSKRSRKPVWILRKRDREHSRSIRDGPAHLVPPPPLRSSYRIKNQTGHPATRACIGGVAVHCRAAHIRHGDQNQGEGLIIFLRAAPDESKVSTRTSVSTLRPELCPPAHQSLLCAAAAEKPQGRSCRAKSARSRSLLFSARWALILETVVHCPSILHAPWNRRPPRCFPLQQGLHHHRPFYNVGKLLDGGV